MTASQAKRDVPIDESSFIASQSQTPTELLTTQFDFGTQIHSKQSYSMVSFTTTGAVIAVLIR